MVFADVLAGLSIDFLCTHWTGSNTRKAHTNNRRQQIDFSHRRHPFKYQLPPRRRIRQSSEFQATRRELPKLGRLKRFKTILCPSFIMARLQLRSHHSMIACVLLSLRRRLSYRHRRLLCSRWTSPAGIGPYDALGVAGDIAGR